MARSRTDSRSNHRMEAEEPKIARPFNTKTDGQRPWRLGRVLGILNDEELPRDPIGLCQAEKK